MAIETINPATGERLRSFSPLDAGELEAKVARAHAAATAWRATAVGDRAGVVRRAGELLDARRSDYGRLMTLEMGKPVKAAIEEAAKCATGCRYYADNGPGFIADEHIHIDGERSYVAYEPLGVVLAVMPWNFPFWQVIRFAAPALVAGNVGLLKHASNVPQCALALEQLFLDAGAPAGVFQTLLIGSDAVESLLNDDRVAAATLTGSEGAGRSVGGTAGRQLKKTVLELGGSDPFIVMPSADVERAVETAVKARTINNGQSCIAAKRFIVAQSIVQRFTDLFVDRMHALVVGDPLNERTSIGPLATERIRDDLHDQVRRSVDAGATLLLGGEPSDGRGFFYPPTVLADVSRQSPAFLEETFGPVAAIIPARDATDAISLANDSRFGLGAAAWTQDASEIEQFARGLDAGTVAINGMVASDPRFPFGGIKASGHGRELSSVGMREFVNIKTVRISRSTGSESKTE